MIIIDLEIITLVCLIIILIYNYYTTECYRIFKGNRSNTNKQNHAYPYYGNNRSNFSSGKYKTINTGSTAMKNIKHPMIELSGFKDKKSDKDNTKIPDNVILNDRYNDFITVYTDDQLNNIITDMPVNTYSSDYAQTLVDDLQKNIIFDMDTKIYTKNKATQKLAKDSATIASRFGRNSLLDSYKNEIDEYVKEKTPWWTETEDQIMPAANIY